MQCPSQSLNLTPSLDLQFNNGVNTCSNTQSFGKVGDLFYETTFDVSKFIKI